ncbi:MAG: hypothetical protein IKD37_00340 [Clostridia bacterium]|nr:hypothetical protein [Clostridia bacterium]
MHEIIRPGVINPAELCEEDYLRTLIGAAVRTGGIDRHDMVRLADQFLYLLAAEAGEFTQHTSTSLPTEQVDQLYASICYTVSLALMPLSPDDAVARLRGVPLKEIFMAGRGVLDQKIRAVSRFMPILRASAIEVEHAPYRFVCQHADRAFFRGYNSRFAAHALDWIPAYLPCLPLTRAGGILYLRAYLQALHTENLICRAAPSALFGRLSERHPSGTPTGGELADHNLCALLLDSLAAHTAPNAVIDRLGLRGRAADYARRYYLDFAAPAEKKG